MNKIAMKIISQKNEFKERIKGLYKRYRLLRNIPPEFEPSFTVKITSEFQKDLYFHSSEKERSEMDKVGIPDLWGIVIMPKTEVLDFIILISSKTFNDDQIVNVAFHEFTHLYDYFQYFLENGNVYIRHDKEKESKYLWEFYHWSEYHAKRVGVLLYSMYVWHKAHGKDSSPSGIYSFPQVEFQSEVLIEKINAFKEAQKSKSQDTNHLFWDLFQELMRYYGRLSVFQEKNLNKHPDEKFPKEFLIDTFGIKCIDLYPLLLQMDTYETAKKQFREIKELKNSILYTINIKEFSSQFF